MVYFKILHLTDIHARKKLDLKPLSKLLVREHINLIVVSGDLTQYGKKKEVRRVLQDLDQLGKPVYYVSGNLDAKDSVDISLTNVKPLDSRVEVFKGMQFVGLSGSNITPFRTIFERTEEEITLKLNELKQLITADTPVILVSHVPPFESEADKLGNGRHVGSTAVKEFILKEKPAAILTGHIHESDSISSIGPTLCVNPGPTRHGQAAVIEVQIYDVGEPFLKGELVKI
ncbi:MAG: metallophosphoesterase family protein [Candidatus Heimdallarchaeota archaeon]